MTEAMELPIVKQRRRRKRWIVRQNSLQLAMQEWYESLEPETKVKVDRLKEWLIKNQHEVNDNCYFGEGAALEVIGAGIAVLMGWREV